MKTNFEASQITKDLFKSFVIFLLTFCLS